MIMIVQLLSSTNALKHNNIKHNLQLMQNLFLETS